jgi:uncharacterized protein YqjF (DUF2071 family)
VSTPRESLLLTAAPTLTRPWRWVQRWQQVLFAHWRVAPSALVPHLPPAVKPDTYDGAAWVSAVAFRLAVRHRGLPAVGPCSNLLEINLRTYVRFRDEPAVYFLRLHADSRVAVRLARWLTPLPYAVARIVHALGDADRFVASRPDGTPLFAATFRPTGPRREVSPDSLDEWLVERYRANVADHRGRLFRMTVQHPPWRLREIEGEVTGAGIGNEWGLDLSGPPDRCHYSDGVDARVLPFEEMT